MELLRLALVHKDLTPVIGGNTGSVEQWNLSLEQRRQIPEQELILKQWKQPGKVEAPV
jgi:hypothetical protein